MKPSANKPLRATIGFEELRELANNASQEVQNVRGDMLAPTARKLAPVYSSVELAELCGIDKAKLLYTAKKGTLPPGTKEGSRLEWSLAEARQWVRHFRKSELRNPEVASAVAIAIANFKGGVSKTTTAVALAQGLSLRGHRVLVVDCDPQGSLTTLFGVLPDTEVEEEHTILPVIAGDEQSITSAIRETYWDGIDLVSAASILFNAEFILPSRQSREDDFQFWTVLDLALEDARSAYDVIIIDTPPALSYVTINALMAAQGVIMPLPPNTLDFASSAQFWSLFTDVCTSLFDKGRTDKRFHFIDVLLSRVDRADAASQIVREWIINAYGSKVLPVEIPKTSIAASASASFGTVYDMSTQNAQIKTLKRARDAYDQFVEHIEMQIESVWAADALPISNN
jgi:chromosome partitioning protein